MRILVAGDYCPQYRIAETIEEEKYDSIFEEAKYLFSLADYSIVNLECPVSSGDTKPIDKIGPNLRCTRRGIEALKWAGVDCVALANNHFLDYDAGGALETIETLDAMGIDHVGGGMNLAEAANVLYKSIGNKRVAIINCCEHEFSIATETTAGSNPLNPVQQFYTIKEAKLNADKVLVIVHGGHEHFQLPSLRMTETYRFFIDAGADVVVNHHQHCFSGYEVYKGKLIFYGLGNFCFDNPEKRSGIWTEGYAVIVNFDSDHPAFTLHPYCQCADKPCVRLLEDNAFENKLKELNGIIADSSALCKAIENYYDSCAEQCSNLFEPIRNRYYLGAKRRGWLPSLISKERRLLLANFIVCESHYDKVKRYLK